MGSSVSKYHKPMSKKTILIICFVGAAILIAIIGGIAIGIANSKNKTGANLQYNSVCQMTNSAGADYCDKCPEKSYGQYNGVFKCDYVQGINKAPTSAPTSASPTSAPTSASPTSAPTATSPTSAPTATSPTSAPTATSPTSAPTAAPVTYGEGDACQRDNPAGDDYCGKCTTNHSYIYDEYRETNVCTSMSYVDYYLYYYDVDLSQVYM